MNIILGMSIDQQASLWAIDSFGWPFDFHSPDLEDSWQIIKNLLDMNLIKFDTVYDKKSFDYDKKSFEISEFINGYFYEHFRGKILKIISLSELEKSFVWSLANTKGYGDSMGYIRVPSPNFSWYLQGIICHWEHVIELQPLPGSSRSEIIQHKNHLRESFAAGLYDEKPAELQKMLREMLEQPIPDDAPEIVDRISLGACPMFGHCCPGGKSKQIYVVVLKKRLHEMPLKLWSSGLSLMAGMPLASILSLGWPDGADFIRLRQSRHGR